MTGGLGEEAIQVYVKVGKITASVLWAIIKALVAHHKSSQNSPKHGKQSLKALAKQRRGLENVDIAKEDIKRMRRELKKYHIDFAVAWNKESSCYNVFFKGQDKNLIYRSLEKFVKNTAKEMAKKSVKERINSAANKKSKAHDTMQVKNKKQELTL